MAARITRSSSPSAKTTRLGLALTRSKMPCRLAAVGSRRAESFWRYARMSAIGFRATPESIAACATAEETAAIRRGSNGVGMMYSGPYFSLRPEYERATSSGTSSRASPASAFAAAIFIASLIELARTSRAPRKM